MAMSKKKIPQEVSKLEGLVGKAIASICALALVLGGYHFSDTRNIVSAQASVESVGARMSYAIDDTVAKLAGSIRLVGGSYLSALNNAGVYAESGVQIALAASRDLLSLTRSSTAAATYEGMAELFRR
jgi:hypothetical protein